MLKLKNELKKNNIYINSWEIFSRVLLLKEIINDSKSSLIIVDWDKQIRNYIKISDFLWCKINSLNNISDLVNVIYNKKWKYISIKEIFNLQIDKISQFEHLNTFEIKTWDILDTYILNKKLLELGYKFSDYENNNSFKIVWDTLFFINNIWDKISISFWDNTIDDILYCWEKVKNFTFWKNELLDLFVEKKPNKVILDKYFESKFFTVLDNIDFYSVFDEISKWLKDYLIFAWLWEKTNVENLWIQNLNINTLNDLKILLEENNWNKIIFTKNKKTIKNFLDLNNLLSVNIIESTLNNLKSFKTSKELVICDDNISRLFIKKRVKRQLSKNLDLLLQIKPWDYIVHIDHWVWIFKEILEKELWGIKKEYIYLEYRNDDKLFVPITEVARISKYVWNENPKLTGLATKQWEKTLKKASHDIEEIANELLDVFAQRKLQKWFKFLPKKEEETKFFNSFEYVYTEDQYTVISEIYKDMESELPMDRLLSWDVWFWKTEVAFAGIFKAITNWKQAALVAPLVVLAYEHYEKAKERFLNFPFNVEVITRFEKPAAIKSILNRLKDWKIDLIIWTHRLLSQDVEFKDLWYLVIDEEHKFWVQDKEKIKKFKWNIDLLSMSATPIPRSLNMALNGLKQVSMLTTPPVWKQAIQTVVSSFNDELIFKAWKKEFERWWQIFFIHNRVATITWMQKYLEQLFPWKKICVVHGQLNGDALEKRIVWFKNREYDILLSTTVVENWIDFPNVNTIFINDAVNFWISQIHQLRWRVWRGQAEWYCYLLFKKDKIKEDAAKRLKTIVDYSHLWAWFELAIKDLEVRWWWDILWIRQSWSSIDIWISLFLEMLENKIEELKQNNIETDEKSEIKIKRINTTIDLNIEAYIDDQYFSSELDKINFYREIESIVELEDLENLIADFKEINPDLPNATINFFNLLRIKIKANSFNISWLKKLGVNYQIDFFANIGVKDVKRFLEYDKDIKFKVVSVSRLRCPIKSFANHEKFIQYLLQLFENKLAKNKIKLKKKFNT